jgi:hypothetical protein
MSLYQLRTLYNWTYAAADKKRDSTDGITHRSISKDEQEIPQIREVFELLVKQHPNYGRLLILDGDDWALAQKTVSDNKTYTIDSRETVQNMFSKAIRKAYRKLAFQNASAQ